MFCKKCGKEVSESSTFCPSCGTNLKESNESLTYGYGVNNQTKVVDNGSVGWVFLGIFLPVVGFILFLVWKDDKPLSSKQAGKGALIGIILQTILSVIITIISLLLEFEVITYVL